MAKQTKPILDSVTGKEYPSMYAAGVDLGKKIVPDYKGADRLIWFSMVRAFPGRFKTKNAAGAYVELDDPSVPKIMRTRRTETPEQEEQRLLARLGELAIAKGAASGNSVAKNATAPRAAKAAVAGAAAATAEIEELEEVEEEAASPTPGNAKAKLGAAVSS